MAKKSRGNDSQPEAEQPEEVVPAAAAIEPVSESAPAQASVPVAFESVTPVIPNNGVMSLHEAVTRYVDDYRYGTSWNAGILKHAIRYGHGPENTADSWIRIFRTYGLKTRE